MSHIYHIIYIVSYWIISYHVSYWIIYRIMYRIIYRVSYISSYVIVSHHIIFYRILSWGVYDSGERTNGKLMNDVQQQRACAANRTELRLMEKIETWGSRKGVVNENEVEMGSVSFVRNRSSPKWANSGHRFYTQWRLLSERREASRDVSVGLPHTPLHFVTRPPRGCCNSKWRQQHHCKRRCVLAVRLCRFIAALLLRY
jgi:hypothetical protein